MAELEEWWVGPWWNTYRTREFFRLTREELFSLIEDRILRINESLCSIQDIRKPDAWIQISRESVSNLLHMIFVHWRREPILKKKTERKLEGFQRDIRDLTSEVCSLKREIEEIFERLGLLVRS